MTTCWKTEDGKIFNMEEDAKMHEAILAISFLVLKVMTTVEQVEGLRNEEDIAEFLVRNRLPIMSWLKDI